MYTEMNEKVFYLQIIIHICPTLLYETKLTIHRREEETGIAGISDE